MAVWVLTVGTGRVRNWEIGRDNQIWATPKRTRISEGDHLYFWLAVGGGRPGRLLATAVARSTPTQVVNPIDLPWPDSVEADYRWSFSLTEVSEFPHPIDIGWTDVRRELGVSGAPQQPRRTDFAWPQTVINLGSFSGRTGQEFTSASILDRRREQVWTLEPGQHMSRAERRDSFGGSTLGGIQPSASSNNVFLYSDPGAGGEFGYGFDGWLPDQSAFLYTGEGQSGEQQLKSGNKAILEHRSTGKAIRLFVADGLIAGTQAKNQMYVGEFEIDDDRPFIRQSSRGLDKDLRTVLVFRLLPVGRSAYRMSDQSSVEFLDLPTNSTEDTIGHGHSALEVRPEQNLRREHIREGTASLIAVRRESELSESFEHWLRAQGHSVRRYRLRPVGELQDLWTDIFDKTTGTLYEAKSSSARPYVRMAIGQLLDYRRFIRPTPSLSLLVPTRPSDDLLALLHAHQIGCVYPDVLGGFRVADAGNGLSYSSANRP